MLFSLIVPFQHLLERPLLVDNPRQDQPIELIATTLWDKYRRESPCSMDTTTDRNICLSAIVNVRFSVWIGLSLCRR